MNNPLISIIVPIYNREHFLPACLDSILNQSYSQWECLLIDDGSTDNSGIICEDYAKRDDRFKVVHQSNQGVSTARNEGIKRALGEWICFIDSDDTVLPLYLEHLSEGVRANGDFVLSNYDKSVPYISSNCTLSGVDFVHFFVEHRLIALSGPIAKLYKSQIVKDSKILFHEEIFMGEDALFILEYMNHVGSVSFLVYSDYNIHKTEGSLSTRYYSFDSEFLCFKYWRNALLQLFTKWNAFDNNIFVAWEQRTDDVFYRTLQCLFKNNTDISFKDQLYILKRIPQQYINEYRQLPTSSYSLSKKVMIWLFVNRLHCLFVLLQRLIYILKSR